MFKVKCTPKRPGEILIFESDDLVRQLKKKPPLKCTIMWNKPSAKSKRLDTLYKD